MLTAILATIFGTNLKRGQRLSSGQVMARDITRSVSVELLGSRRRIEVTWRSDRQPGRTGRSSATHSAEF